MPNLFDEKRPMQSLPPQGAADAPAGDGDDLVADVVAVGLVDQGEIVNAGKQEGALDRLASCGAEGPGQLLGHLVRLSWPVSSS
jgi:hypothetical protein